MHDIELSLFKCAFLEQKHNASVKQYLERYYWIEIELDPLIVLYPEPIKGFMKSLYPLLPDIMISYHISQLITTAKKTNITKFDLLKLVEEKFDGNVDFVSIDNSNTICLIMWFVVICFYYASVYHVENTLSVAWGSVLVIEGGCPIYYYFIINNVMLYTDMKFLAENDDENQNHDPTVDNYHDGFHDNMVQQYNWNAVQENHQNQSCSGIGTFTM